MKSFYQNLLYDVRIKKHLIKQGILNQGDWDKYLKKLDDAKDNVHEIKVFDDIAEELNLEISSQS